ncbi:MAG: hypothetical protein IPO78_07515 [Saprospiraceae bacterium]|nr:hypothetical protein [Saprospiraceae bacterium]MBK8449726.1 hypothetical protein [Saprospiraceae bacterium]MBK8484204.1 hypothetical protein [Saprospiraceae bacterium]MBK9221607.1 hypothetical protein [Saprospiraceae bacterium]MBK9721455.1 hypothetical protein [Saprospiraceae bacterium]
MFRLLTFVILLYFHCIVAFSQQSSDSIPAETEGESSVFSVLFKGNPGKALTYSLILPGAGQVYNGRIWKVPIIYAGFGFLIYSVQFNSKQFKRFDNAYHQRVDSLKDEFEGILSLSGINSYRQYYDKNLQLSYIGIGILYLLNGIEAFVDRHLQEFDVSKNLSFQYKTDPFQNVSQVSMIWLINPETKSQKQQYINTKIQEFNNKVRFISF